MTDRDRQTGQGTAAVVVMPALVSLVMAGLGWRPTQARGGWPAIEAMLVALAIVLGAIYITTLPALRRMASAASSQYLTVAFKAAGLRFVIVLAATLAVMAQDWLPKRAFLVWIGLAYVVLTMTETVTLARWMNVGTKK